MRSKLFFTYFSPARFILFSFSLLICVGTALLALPLATVRPVSLLDLLFTATSVTCVTGLFVVPLDAFSRFGQFIIMLLMQFGALGLSTIWLSIVYMIREPGLTTKVLAMQVLEIEEGPIVKNLLKFILRTTFLIESIGFLILFPLFLTKYSIMDALFFSAFHVVSAFCNAGISYDADPNAQHLVDFGMNFLFLYTTILLIFFGGIGFITIQELCMFMKARMHGKYYTFSLTTKVVLLASTTFAIIFGILFFLIERNHALSGLSLPMQWTQTLFHVISFKSCGFTTISVHQLQPATLLISLLSGFIGSSPSSTGSGVKVTTFVLYLATIRAAILGRDSVDIAHREIAISQVYKTIAIVALSSFWICFILFLLLISEVGWNFFDALYEVVNAATNLGISIKGTSNLSITGRLLILLTMLIGRVGSLTFIASFKNRHRRDTVGFSYPQEHIMLG